MSESELKVLLIAGTFEVRGSSAYTLRLAERLEKHGVPARVLCRNASVVEPSRRAALRIRESPHIQTPLWGRIVLESVRRELSRDPPDLIHIQSWSSWANGVWLARRLDRPFVLSVHDLLPAKQRSRFDVTGCRRIIAVSESVKSDLEARWPRIANRITVIHSGVERPAEGAVPPVLEPGHVPVVGSAGPLEAVKGFPFLLGAAQRVLAVESNVEFLLAGAGPEEGNLRRLARELEISTSVTFISNLFDFSTSLAAMDIFCLPSLQQGLGTIMLEAMALGRPVIATSVGGVYSVVRDNETGLAVPPSDSGRLAERILELLRDPVRARALGESGRRLVIEQFGVEQMVDQTAALYREVLAERHAR